MGQTGLTLTLTLISALQYVDAISFSFVNADLCKLKNMAGVTTGVGNFNRNFKLTCLLVSVWSDVC